MTTTKKIGIAFAAVVFGLVLSPTLASNEAFGAFFEKDKFFVGGFLTAPSGEKPFGGEKVGGYTIAVKEDHTRFYIDFEKRSSEGTILEGWLVDTNTGEKLSIGKFNPGQLRGFFSKVEDPTNYELLVITEEPIVDKDSAPHKPIGGVPFSIPTGL